VTRLQKWFCIAAEKFLDRYNEGPRPPRRFAEMAEDFHATHPSPADSLAFAIGIATSAYRDGYLRGFECTERWERPWASSPTPEEIADAEEPNWRSSPSVALGDWED
jgi:hypothetical protein